MAVAIELVLSDVLCFVKDKYTKIAAKQLRSVLVDFYSIDSLSEAKVRLLGDITAMNLPQKLPHIPQRRHCAGRLEAETDDLLTMFTFLDELKMLNQLPNYVSNSPDNMPSLRLYEGDVQILLTLLKAMDGRRDEYGLLLGAITRDVSQLQVCSIRQQCTFICPGSKCEQQCCGSPRR